MMSVSSDNKCECVRCFKTLQSGRHSRHVIPCKNHHIYCPECLKESIIDCIRTKQSPKCFISSCNYKLTRYDIFCLPIAKDLIEQIILFLTNPERPQCPLCLFYVECQMLEVFQSHVLHCNPSSLRLCEFCDCFCEFSELFDHKQKCKNKSPYERQEFTVNFLTTRTKYPLTSQQIRYFLEKQRKHGVHLDLKMIVDQLAKFETKFPYEVPTKMCDICVESCFYDNIFVYDCDSNHKVCYVCFEKSCTSKMKQNEILTCALCNYVLNDGELKYLRVSNEEKKRFFNYQQEKTLFSYLNNTSNVIKCPNQRCKWAIEIDDPNQLRCVTCRKCQSQFCSMCGEQYHYRVTCQEISQITQYWIIWCNTERGNYWRLKAQLDGRFRVQLDEYERQLMENQQRNEELRIRYEELMAGEAFKAANCRLCPTCGRVIERIEGCDLMVCGRDYHMKGNPGAGCGSSFNWKEAKFYVPMENNGPKYELSDLQRPELQQDVVHYGVKCKICEKDIEGIRFDCIHCESLTFCEKCEQDGTLEHFNDLRNKNKQQHVFQVIRQPI